MNQLKKNLLELCCTVFVLLFFVFSAHAEDFGSYESYQSKCESLERQTEPLPLGTFTGRVNFFEKKGAGKIVKGPPLTYSLTIAKNKCQLKSVAQDQSTVDSAECKLINNKTSFYVDRPLIFFRLCLLEKDGFLIKLVYDKVLMTEVEAFVKFTSKNNLTAN